MDYIKGAQSRGYTFDLTYEQFIQFWQEPCFYCHARIPTIGLDRIYNKEHYVIDNIVPCCSVCNRMKSNLCAGVFIDKCKAIAKIEHPLSTRTIRDTSYDMTEEELNKDYKNKVTSVTIAKAKHKI